ncbi:MAG TPA: glycosyltransferase family 4 protein [Burkholderiales bacterium]|jgi:UDP-glucose:(heptosyl)LPS alpha-1,3-glucosyltransferase
MRLAIVRQKYNPYGGAERFIERAVAALRAKEEVEVTLLAREWKEAPGYQYWRVNPPYRGSLTRDRGFSSAVQRALATAGDRFDLVQSHERIPGIDIYRAGDGVHATWLALRGRAQNRWERLRVRFNPYHPYVLKQEQKMFTHRKLRAVICNSAMVRDDIAARFGTPAAKLHVIYNGVDLEAFHPRNAAEGPGMRALLNIEQKAPLFLYVGSGFERKGVARLLQALAGVPAPACAVIVGADKRTAGYQAQAKQLGLAGRVHFLGPREDLAALYGMADAFVLPTLYDPMPNAALEALASGLPVITTQQCGAREFIRAGENGYVADALDVPAFTQAMQSLAGGGAADMRAAARASVAHLSLDAMATELMALYRGLSA